MVVALVGLGVAIYKFVSTQRRREAFALLAAELGFDYSRHDPFGLVHLPFSLFAEGDGRGVENVLAGERDDRPVKLFDYWYYDEHRDQDGDVQRTYHRFSCALTVIPASCPPLAVEPEGLWSRLKDHLGFRDVEMESEEFNRRFEVQGEDRRLATALLAPAMMEWLMAHADDCRYEVLGNQLLCASSRRRPEDLTWLLGQLEGFRIRVPSVVAELYPQEA